MTEGNGFTVKEILVNLSTTVDKGFAETRGDIKELHRKVDTIDRQGSIGTKTELQDHESRLRDLERFRFSFPNLASFTSLLASAAAVAVVWFK